MKPASFDYHRPETLEEVLDLLARYGEDCKLLAGGQSLVPLLNLRLARPKVVIDINRVTSLAYVEPANGGLRLGSLSRQKALASSASVAESLPLLHAATHLIGHEAIRTRGTIGGSIAHADPAAELPGAATALGAEMVLRSKNGQRVVSSEDFFAGFLTTVLQPDEILIEVRVPTVPPGTGWAFLEIARRQGDFALAGVATLLRPGEGGRIELARLVSIGCGPTPLRIERAESLLLGEVPHPQLWEEAARKVGEEVDPQTDFHATADYRRQVTMDLTRQGLAQAWQRSKAQR